MASNPWENRMGEYSMEPRAQETESAPSSEVEEAVLKLEQNGNTILANAVEGLSDELKELLNSGIAVSGEGWEVVADIKMERGAEAAEMIVSWANDMKNADKVAQRSLTKTLIDKLYNL